MDYFLFCGFVVESYASEFKKTGQTFPQISTQVLEETTNYQRSLEEMYKENRPLYNAYRLLAQARRSPELAASAVGEAYRCIRAQQEINY